MNKPRIIVLAGDAGHGKSTVAKHMETAFGVMRYRFAGAIKAMLIELLHKAGDTREAAEIMVEDAIFKNVAIRELYRYSPRDLMRKIGDMGRSIDKEFWASIVMNGIHAEHRNDPTLWFSIDDWRYPEGEGSRLLAGDVKPFFVRVNRPDAPPSVRDHSSEGGLDHWEYDWILWNRDNQLNQLHRDVNAMLRHFQKLEEGI